MVHLWPWLDAHAPEWRSWRLAACCAGAGHRCCAVCVGKWIESGAADAAGDDAGSGDDSDDSVVDADDSGVGV